MTIGRIYLWTVLACGAAACGVAGLSSANRGEFLILAVLSFAGFVPLIVFGGILLGLRVSRPTITCSMVTGFLGGSAALGVCSLYGNVPLLRTEVVGPFVLPVIGGGVTFVMTAMGLLVGSHIPPGVTPSHLCQRCGYDRRGLHSGVPCPECGA